MIKTFTVVITNQGRKPIFTAMRGAHHVTVLEVVITDDQTGAVTSRHTVHSAERDTLTLKSMCEVGELVVGRQPGAEDAK